jgi:TPR repeat protein
MYRLGMIYLEGKGGEVDIEIAIKWLELASQGGANLANDALAEIYRSGKGVPKNPAKALTLLRQAAENGMYKAQLELGLMLFYGDGVERDEAEAYKLLNEYVTDRSWPDPRALNALGHMLDDGKVTPKDPERAFKYHLLGAEAGLITSQFSVAYAYQTGRGTKLNLVEAVKWHREAAEEGLPIAQCNLGKILMSGGLGVAADPVEGFSWSLRAAMSGLSEAQMGVAIHLYTGTGTPKDYVEAYAWANIAAAGGNVARAKELRDEIEMKLDPAQLAEAQKRSKTLNEKIAEEVIGSHRRQRAKELLERKGA